MKFSPEILPLLPLEEMRAAVRDALASLAPRDALALRLFYEEDLGHREIGAVLGVPVTHVGQILARAREKVRLNLARAGLADHGTGGPS